MVTDLKYFEITGLIIGLAMEVHRNMRGGNFTESLFQRALLKELRARGVSHESQKEMDVFYKGELIGRKRVDILINKVILVELKVVSSLEPIHFNQVINYLHVFNLEVGLLLNFGAKSLQYKRFINNRL